MFPAAHLRSPLPRFHPTMDTRARPSHRWLGDLLVQSRLVRVTPDRILGAAAEAALPFTSAPVPVGAAGSFQVLQPFTPTPAGTAWVARGRLVGRGPRVVRSARVEITISAHSTATFELRLHPVARAPHTWGARRLRRYLDLAQAVADDLERRIQRAGRPNATSFVEHAVDGPGDTPLAAA